MNYKYKRSFIFIRELNSTAFYSDSVDFVSRLRAAIPAQIKITSTKQGDTVDCVSFWFPEFEDYNWFTENLYISGAVKQEFRSAMIYAKTNKLAFCLPSVNLQNYNATNITRHWYCNIKSEEEKFYDTTPGQKKALALLTGIMSWKDSVHSVTIFDYNHNIKFTETAVIGSVTINELGTRLQSTTQELFPLYDSDKQEFNMQHNIKHLASMDNVVRTDIKFNLEPISYVLPLNMQQIVLEL